MGKHHSTDVYPTERPQLRILFMNEKNYWDSRYLVGIGIYFGKSKKKETFIYNSS